MLKRKREHLKLTKTIKKNIDIIKLYYDSLIAKHQRVQKTLKRV